MSFLNSVLKVFVGDKSKQDVKSIMPIVNEIKRFEPKVSNLSHDELRAKTEEFKSKIQSACAQHHTKIEQLRETIKVISDTPCSASLAISSNICSGFLLTSSPLV